MNRRDFAALLLSLRRRRLRHVQGQEAAAAGRADLGARDRRRRRARPEARRHPGHAAAADASTRIGRSPAATRRMRWAIRPCRRGSARAWEHQHRRRLVALHQGDVAAGRRRRPGLRDGWRRPGQRARRRRAASRIWQVDLKPEEQRGNAFGGGPCFWNDRLYVATGYRPGGGARPGRRQGDLAPECHRAGARAADRGRRAGVRRHRRERARRAVDR